MARRQETNARNSTISINEQTRQQRAQITLRYDGKGVSSENASTLFPSSPIYSNDRSGDGDRGDLFDDQNSNIYDAFAKVIDPSESINGFGFLGDDKASLNYEGSKDLFSPDGKTLAISDGKTNSVSKAFNGFPNLQVNKDAINSPSTNQDNPSPSLVMEPDGSTYGNKTVDYRKSVSSKEFGFYLESGLSNGVSNERADTLGKYFTSNYTQEEGS